MDTVLSQAVGGTTHDACELERGGAAGAGAARRAGHSAPASLQVNRGITGELSNEEPGRERMVVVIDARGASSLALTRHMSLLKHLAVALNQHYPVRGGEGEGECVFARMGSVHRSGCNSAVGCTVWGAVEHPTGAQPAIVQKVV